MIFLYEQNIWISIFKKVQNGNNQTTFFAKLVSICLNKSVIFDLGGQTKSFKT
jgi:hypothetical protein